MINKLKLSIISLGLTSVAMLSHADSLICYDTTGASYTTSTNVVGVDKIYHIRSVMDEEHTFNILSVTNPANTYSTWLTTCLGKTKNLAGISIGANTLPVPSSTLVNTDPLFQFTEQNPLLVKNRLKAVLPALLDSTRDFSQFTADLNRSGTTLSNADGETIKLYSTTAGQGVFNVTGVSLANARSQLETALVSKLNVPYGTPARAAADFIITMENQSALQSTFFQIFAYSKYGINNVTPPQVTGYPISHSLMFLVSPDLKTLNITLDETYTINRYNLGEKTDASLEPIQVDHNPTKGHVNITFAIDLTKYTTDYGRLSITVDSDNAIFGVTPHYSNDAKGDVLLAGLIQSLMNQTATTINDSNSRTGKIVWTFK